MGECFPIRPLSVKYTNLGESLFKVFQYWIQHLKNTLTSSTLTPGNNERSNFSGDSKPGILGFLMDVQWGRMSCVFVQHHVQMVIITYTLVFSA
jgi:hypothetical protein